MRTARPAPPQESWAPSDWRAAAPEPAAYGPTACHRVRRTAHRPGPRPHPAHRPPPSSHMAAGLLRAPESWRGCARHTGRKPDSCARCPTMPSNPVRRQSAQPAHRAQSVSMSELTLQAAGLAAGAPLAAALRPAPERPHPFQATRRVRPSPAAWRVGGYQVQEPWVRA